jgi:C1A family cysteine protease
MNSRIWKSVSVGALAALHSAAIAGATCLSVPADINGDGATSVTDVQCAILANLWNLEGKTAAAPGCLGGDPQRADLNCDGQIDVVDAITVVSLVLGIPLDSKIDTNSNLCADACEVIPVPDGAWGNAQAELPKGAVLLASDEIAKLEGLGTLTPVTPKSLAEEEEAKLEQLKEDYAVVEAFLLKNPKLESRFFATPAGGEVVPTPDGNWRAKVMVKGELREFITQGEAARIKTIAATIRHSQSKDNQKLKYQVLKPLASEACQELGPTDLELESLDADQIRAEVSALVACWKAETLPDETPDSSDYEPTPDPVAPPPPPADFVANPDDYEGAATSPTDGSDDACEPTQSIMTNWSGKNYLTCIKDQGNRGSCVSFAITSALENAWARKKSKWVNLSEQALYAEAKLDWNGESYGDGLNTQDTAEELFETGWSQPYESIWNYNPSWSRMDLGSSYIDSCDGYSGPACSDTSHQAEVVCEQVGGFSFCYFWRPTSPGNSGIGAGTFVELCDFEDDDLDTAKMYLSSGYGLVAGMDVTTAWQNAPSSGFFGSSMGSNIGGHAVHIVRYVPNSQLPQNRWGSGGGRVVIKNSWSCWADGGFGYLQAGWVNDKIKSLSALLPKAVGTNQPPKVTLLAPIPNATFPYGGFMNFQTLKASATDLEDGDDCCTFHWQSSKDGDLGDGATIQYQFATMGSRVITVTATDKNGKKSAKSITVTATNTPPQASILSPSQNGTVAYKGVPFVFQGKGTDNNEVVDLPCSSLSWKSSNASDAIPATGCSITPTFNTTGIRTITLKVTDAKGATASATRTVNVQNPPLNQPPQVTILFPATNDMFLDAYTTVQLKASAVDPDGLPGMTYKWTIQAPGVPVKQIGTTLNLNWKPSNDVPFNCGGTSATLKFSATDANGTTTQTRTVYIYYPPC